MRIGFLGAGQLAMMMGQAATTLGCSVHALESTAGTCANQVMPVTVGDFSDTNCLTAFAETVDCVTIESENIPQAALAHIANICQVYPKVDTLATCQDRLLEKRFLQKLHIPTAPFMPVEDDASLRDALSQLGTPAILKTRRLGYDGKGQIRINQAKQADAIKQCHPLLANQPCVLEGMVDFDYEVSQISVRDHHGTIRHYPLVENTHRAGILRLSHLPCQAADDSLSQQAQAMMTQVLQAFDYVGVLVIEFFVCNQTLIANEMAPRVHNSGHWSIEGANVSQFTQHIRAITQQAAQAISVTEMVSMWNMIGNCIPPESLSAFAPLCYHDYSKAARPGRKLGHITLVGGTAAAHHAFRRLALETPDQTVTP